MMRGRMEVLGVTHLVLVVLLCLSRLTSAQSSVIVFHVSEELPSGMWMQ